MNKFLFRVSIYLVIKIVESAIQPDLLFNPAKNAIFAGGYLRLKSIHNDCWLELKEQRYTGTYEDGSLSGQRPLGGCTPTYPDKINPNLRTDIKDFHKLWLYEQDGPFLEVTLPGQEDNSLNPGFDDTFFHNNSLIQLTSSKAFYTRLEVRKYRAPVSRDLHQVSSDLDLTYSKAEADWKIIILPQEKIIGKNNGTDKWRKNQIFQMYNVASQTYLGVTGEWMPEYLGIPNFKEIAAFTEDYISEQNFKNTLWTVDKIRLREDFEVSEDNDFYALYGDGDIDLIDELKRKHMALSNEDIQILHKNEVKVVTELLQIYTEHELNNIFEVHGFSVEIVKKSDTNHPIDNFNLLKRISLAWKAIQEKTKDQKIKDILGSILEAYYQDWSVCKKLILLGLLNIQRFHNFDPEDLINGEIKYGGKTYKSISKLTVEDVKMLATEAKNNNWLSFQIFWLESLPELIEEYKNATKEHDHALADPIHTMQNQIATFIDPINKDASEKAFNYRSQYEKEKNFICSEYGRNFKANLCDSMFEFDHTQRLCAEPHLSAVPKTENICSDLHFKDPYLKLGPFKLEHLNSEPVIEMIHDLVYPDEILDIQDQAKGEMRSTPYVVNNDQLEISFQRTSKVKYYSERVNDWAAKTTKRLELATTLNIFNPNYRFTSENYQVMNYGVGGYISEHMDEFTLPDSLALCLGGGRFTTAMLYLTGNLAGGKTIFPAVNVGVEPEAGALLYWTLKVTTSNVDYRMGHLGCPVAYGNKWIANKWVRFTEQMNRFPCYADLKNKLFPPHHYKISYDNPLQYKNILEF